jgi:hypothetical protein
MIRSSRRFITPFARVVRREVPGLALRCNSSFAWYYLMNPAPLRVIANSTESWPEKEESCLQVIFSQRLNND